MKSTKAKDKYRISDQTCDMDIDAIHGFLSQSYWAAGISRSLVKRALDNSLCFGIFDGEGKQVAFARAITDCATFAYLSDVFVVETHRGQGLAKWLLQTMASHPSLQGLRRTMLATEDAHGLYRRFGFTPIQKPDMFMQQWNPDVYASSAKADAAGDKQRP